MRACVYMDEIMTVMLLTCSRTNLFCMALTASRYIRLYCSC